MNERSLEQVRPTRVRWLVLAVATLSSVLLYLDRICVSFAVESIRVDFGASQQQMGWFLGAFFWSYALGQVPAGWLSDRFGNRRMLTIYILSWSLFTALLGLSTGIVSLLAYRLGCGLAQAGAYPSCAKAVRDWMPLTKRGIASSFVAFGGRIGGAIAPLLTGAVMIALALQQHSATLMPAEVLNPQTIAGQLVLGSDSATATWQSLVWQQLQNPQRQQLQTWAAQDEFTADEREEVTQFLNQLRPLAVLARASESQRKVLPSDVRQRVERYGVLQEQQAESALELTDRQFWDVTAVGSLRKLEARGWRSTLVIYGGAGLVVAGLFWIVFRDSPHEHPWCNAAEASLIGNPPVSRLSHAAESGFPWGALLRNVGLWGNCLCQFMTNVGWVFLVTWLPRYLDEVHKIPVLERGFMASLPIFAGMIGMLAGGPWTDVLTSRYGLRWGRRIPIALSRVTAASGYGLCVLVTTGVFGELGTRGPAWAAIAGLAVVAISTDLGVAATWAYAQDIAGRHTAAVLGWGNMWGNFGAALAPPLSGMLLGEQATLANWNTLFYFCGGAFLLSAGGGWLMDSSRPLAEADSPR